MSASTLEITSPGPFVPIEHRDTISVPAPDGWQGCCSKVKNGMLSLPLTLTLPYRKDSPSAAPTSLKSCPVLLFFNGFQSQGAWYRPFSLRLASWGFAVLQYNAPTLRIIKDKDELQFLDPILSWAQHSTRTTGHFAQGCLDLDQLCLTGHSRGGKLAALHYSTNSQIKAACLIDPVDNTKFTPESESYPSACRALARCNKPVAIVGAGIIGSGNPEGSNWRAYYSAAAPSSCLTLLNRAGHGQFMHINRAADWLLDKALGAGSDSRQQVLDNTVPTMLAWFTHQLQTAQQPARAPAPAVVAAGTPAYAYASTGVGFAGGNAGLWSAAGWGQGEEEEVHGGGGGLMDLPPAGDVGKAFRSWVKQFEACGEIEYSAK